nr:hypothetical protein [Bacillus siamensis]
MNNMLYRKVKEAENKIKEKSYELKDKIDQFISHAKYKIESQTQTGPSRQLYINCHWTLYPNCLVADRNTMAALDRCREYFEQCLSAHCKSC